LYKYITGIVQANKHKLIAINGAANHVHVFVGYKPHQLIPDLLQDIKGSSSKWMNKRQFVRGQFQWQAGYGVFSYSHTQIDSVVKYLQRQEEHHRKRTFQEEYLQLLERFNIPHDKRYILKDIG